MGRSSLEGMLEVMKGEQALRWHLQYNHYPPLPSCIFKVAKQAIALANEDDWDARIDLKESGMSWRGKNWAPVSACIEEWHLDSFISRWEE